MMTNPEDDRNDAPITWNSETDEIPAVVRATDDIPTVIPVVFRGASLPPPLPVPGPGIIFAFLWCLAFVGVMAVTFTVTMLVDFFALASQQENPQAWLQEQTDIDPGHVVIPDGLARAIRTGMLGAEIGTILFALIVLRVKVGRDWAKKIALQAPSAEHFVIALLSIPAFLIVSGMVSTGLQQLFGGAVEDEQMSKALRDIFAPWPWWLAVLCIGVGPGIGEELWCRGFLGRGLVARYGLVIGIFATSCLFGAMHGPAPFYILTTLFMGACLHLTYYWTRSLWLSMLIHFGNNSFAILLATGTLQLPFLGGEKENPSEWVIVTAIILFVSCAYALYATRYVLRPVEEPIGPVKNPRFTSVETPPESSQMQLVQASSLGLPLGMVLLAFAGFVLSCWMALPQPAANG